MAMKYMEILSQKLKNMQNVAFIDAKDVKNNVKKISDARLIKKQFKRDEQILNNYSRIMSRN